MIEGNNETLFIPGHHNTQNKRPTFLTNSKEFSVCFSFYHLAWTFLELNNSAVCGEKEM